MVAKFIISVFLTAVEPESQSELRPRRFSHERNRERSCDVSACEDGRELDDLTRRASDYVLKHKEPLVSDFTLVEDWYDATGPSGHYMMPDTMPSYEGCGTLYQIYLKDPSATPVATTSSPAPTNFEPGTIAVTPTLLWTSQTRGNVIINSPTLVFKCSFAWDATLMFRVSWYVNGHLHFSYGPTRISDDLDLSTGKLVEKGFHMGINLQCGVQASVDQSGVPTVSQYSSEFYAGIQAVNSTLTLDSSHDSGVVQLKSTIPIGCTHIDGREVSCESKKLHVQMSNPDFTCEGDDVLAFERRSTGIDLQTKSSTWSASDVYEFTVTSKFTTVESDTYSLYLQTDPSFTDTFAREFFAGQQLPTITVISSRDGWIVAMCYSHVDPHVKSSDNRYHYENQYQGYYLLFRNTEYDIEVQERTSLCSRRAMCTCSVAVRAGADVFVINRCPGTTRLNEFVLCNDGGTLDVVKNDEYSYTIDTPTGTVIRIYLWPSRPHITYKNFMNIDICLSPKDMRKTEGLCGFYDGNPANDYKKRDGTVVYIPRKRGNRDFTDSWRLLPTENLFNRTNLENLQNWESTNQLICVCNQSFPFLHTGTAAVEESSSFCGTTQFAGCFKAKSITDKKCAKIVQGNKRSLSRRSNNIGLLLLIQPAADMAYKNRENQRDERSVLEYQLTDEDAIGNCTQIINNSPAAVAFPERFENEQLLDLIDQCSFDVKAENDLSVGYSHSESLNEMLKHMLSYEPTFVANNAASITAFMRQTCLNNCSSRGYCSDEGECVCDNQYYDPDCSLYVGDPIHVTVLPDEGICDPTLGDCDCSWFFTENLLDNFTCKLIRKQVDISGTKTLIDEQSVRGNFDDRFTGQCCWQESRRKRSTNDNVLGYEIQMHISNDGATFGNGQILYVIDETCVEVVTNTFTGEKGISIQTGFCMIDGRCYTDSENMVSDPCRSCKTGLDEYDWTYVCDTSSGNSKSYTVIIAVCVTVVSIALVVLVVVVVTNYCKQSSRINQANSFDPQTRHVRDVNARTVFHRENSYFTDPIPCFMVRDITYKTDAVPSLNSTRGEPEHDVLDQCTLPPVFRGEKGRFTTDDLCLNAESLPEQIGQFDESIQDMKMRAWKQPISLEDLESIS